MTKKKVLVIGAGAGGLSAVYGLNGIEGQPFDITVIDKRDEIGGNVITEEVIVDGKKNINEYGPTFVGSKEAYPIMHQLFDILGEELRGFSLSTHVFDPEHPGETDILLPPVVTNQRPGFFCLPLDISIHTLFHEFYELFKIEMTNLEASSELREEGSFVMLRAFLDEKLPLTEVSEEIRKKNEHTRAIMMKILGGAWGINKFADIREFGAAYSMNYLTLGQTWYEAVNGLISYMHKMMSKCPGTKFVLGKEVDFLTEVKKEEGGLAYQVVIKNEGYLLNPDTNQPAQFDHIVLGSPSYATKAILHKCTHEDTQRLIPYMRAAAKLYYPTTILFHKDHSFLSPTHGENVCVYNKVVGETAFMSVLKPTKITDFIKTWWHEGLPRPNHVHREVNFFHPMMTLDYFNLQKVLKAHNSSDLNHAFPNNIQFVGLEAGNNDSHETALWTGFKAAQRICTQYGLLEKNQHLFPFIHSQTLKGEVTENTNQLGMGEKEKSRCCAML